MASPSASESRPSATTWSPGFRRTRSPVTSSLTAASRGSSVAHHRGGRRDERGEPVERMLRADLLRDADRRVRDQHPEEERITPIRERERQRAEHDQDQIEDRERVRANDAARTSGCVAGGGNIPALGQPPARLDLAQPLGHLRPRRGRHRRRIDARRRARRLPRAAHLRILGRCRPPIGDYGARRWRTKGQAAHDVRDGGRWSWSPRRPRPCTSFCRGSRAYDDTWGRLASGDAPWLCAGVLFEIVSYGAYVYTFHRLLARHGSRIGWRASTRSASRRRPPSW